MNVWHNSMLVSTPHTTQTRLILAVMTQEHFPVRAACAWLRWA